MKIKITYTAAEAETMKKAKDAILSALEASKLGSMASTQLQAGHELQTGGACGPLPR